MIRAKRAILIPLVAMLALAVPSTASALEGPEGNKSPVHWQVNSLKRPSEVHIPVIAWGTFKLESTAGIPTCKTSEYIEDTNTAAGKAASEVLAYTSFGCKVLGGEFCVAPEEERLTGVNLTPDASPDTGVWPSVTVEEGVVDEGTFRSYDRSGLGAGENPIRLNMECYATNGEKVANLLFKSGGAPTGTSTPLLTNGTNAVKPSEISFEDPKKETGHLYAESQLESVKEEIVEPAVKIEAGPALLTDEGGPWAPIIKPGCRVTAKNLFRNDLVKEVLPPKALVLENKVNPGKEGGLATIVEPVKFNCGPLVSFALESTTLGKLKFVGYLDNGLTPLVTIGHSNAP